MIIVKVGEPNNKNVGDVWFDPTTKVTQRAVVLRSPSTFAPVVEFAPMNPAQLAVVPANPNKGDIWINPIDAIPTFWDGNSWIPAVPNGYIFPPSVPKAGDAWTEQLTQITYLYYSGNWQRMSTLVTSLPAGAPMPNGPFLQGNGSWTSVTTPPPPQVLPPGAPIQNVNLAPQAAGGGAGNIVIVPTPMFHSPSNNITITGPNNQMLATINTLTGAVSYGPGYTPDAAAQIFWRALAGASPRFLQSRIDGLVQDLKEMTSRLAVAEGHVLKFTQAGHKLPEPPKPFDPMDAWDKAMGIIK